MKLKNILSMALCAAIMLTATNLFILPAALPAKAASAAPLPYQDTGLTFKERAADLISRMTLAEKQNQLGDGSAAIPRLGVPSARFWNEGLHGVANHNSPDDPADIGFTSFPSPMSMASSWNSDLMLKISTVISNEARGCQYILQNAAVNADPATRLSYFSPTINLARDPRWGRNEEAYSEDPFLTAVMGRQFVDGMQGTYEGVGQAGYYSQSGEKYYKLIPTIKHYALNNSETTRDTGSSDADDKSIRNYYTWAFQDISLKTRVGAVMAAYNSVNGTPMPANKYLLDTLLRKTWGFTGYVVSDCGAFTDMVTTHKWVPDWHTDGHVVTITEAAAYGLLAGCTMSCGAELPQQAINAVNAGLMTESDIDKALLEIFTRRMQTGEFDPKEDVAYQSITGDSVATQDNLALSEESSREGIIMLKDDGILPVNLSGVNSIAVYGPLVRHCELGNYSSGPNTQMVDFQDGLTDYLTGHGFFARGGKLDFFDGVDGSADRGTNLINLRSITFSNGVVRQAPSYDALSGNEIKNEGTNIGFIQQNNYILFKGMDVTGLTRIDLSVSTPNNGASVATQVHVGAPDGPVIAVVNSGMIPGDWSNYVTKSTTDIDLQGLTGPQDIYLVFDFDDSSTDNLNMTDIAKASGYDLAIVYTGSTSLRPETAVPPVSGFGDGGEGNDRVNLKMPKGQDLMIAAVADLNPNTVAVIHSNSIYDISKFKDKVKGILYSSYNGQFQGVAMPETIFGDNNPGGRLTVTWYADESQLAPITDYTLYPDADGMGRTYMHFTGDVQYPFGYGLSYTSFQYLGMSLDKSTVAADGTFNVSVQVKNTGSVKGAEVVQIYAGIPGAGTGNIPEKQLKGFKRVELDPGATATVDIPVNVSDLSYVFEDNGQRTVTPGTYHIMAGMNCDDIKFTKDIAVTAAAPKLMTATLVGDSMVARIGASVPTALTLAMTDETFLDPKNAVVTYTSKNTAVATVAADGTVKAAGGGVTLITASATLNGVTLKADFPVVVQDLPYANDIKIDGVSLPGFNYSKTSYDYMLPAGYTGFPAITGDIPQGLDMTAAVTLPASLPGTASVKVTRGDASVTYLIKLYFPPSDETWQVARFSGIEKTFTAPNGGQPNLYADWTWLDGNKPVDLQTHDPDKLYLRLNVNLTATPSTGNLDNAFVTGTVKLRSTDVTNKPGDPSTDANNSEHNFGWNIDQNWGLKTGDNFIEIPLGPAMKSLPYDTLSTNSRGLIDWSSIERLIFYIDSVSRSEFNGVTFTMTLSNVMIVDVTLEEQLAILQGMTETPIPQGDYEDEPYATYLAAFDTAKATADKGMANTAAEVRKAISDLQAAADALDNVVNPPEPPVTPKLGDVNADGKIDTVDARLVLQYIVKKIDLATLNDTAMEAADVNGDGKIDTVDARLILQYIVNKITEFPTGA